MSDYNSSLKCTKISLAGIIILFMLTGLIMCVIGVIFVSKNDVVSDLFNSGHYAPALIFMITGISIFAISGLGLYGVIKENTNLIFLFLVCLIITLIIEVVGAVWFVLIQDNMMAFASERFKNLMSLYETNREARMTVDLVQQSLKCCGAKGSSDWVTLNPNISTGNNPMLSCFDRTGLSKIGVISFQSGCISQVAALLSDNLWIILITAICVLIIQLTGMYCTSVLGKLIKSHKIARDMKKWPTRYMYFSDKNGAPQLPANRI